MARNRIAAALILCLGGGILSLVLLSKHYGIPLLGEAVLAACGAGGGCDVVSQSRYSSLFGVPLAAAGLFFYAALLALLAPCLSGWKDDAPAAAPSFGFYLVGLALAIDLVLLGLQAFVIKAFCEFCLATYVVNLLTLGLLWPFRQTSRAASFFSAAPERRGLLAWSVAALFAALATLSMNSALVDRKALAGTSILGTPVNLQPPQTIQKSSVEERLAEAQAEARKWKDTLDDERRLQIYLNDKAKNDFNDTEVTKIDLSRAPAIGAKDGPIASVSFSDFMCPFCRDLALGLRNYLPASGNRVRSYYKHFPLDTACNPRVGRTVHQGACDLALGGVCAAESGRFWEFHDKVFARTWDKATREDVLGIGVSVGLDRSQLNSCMNSAAAKGILAKDIEEGWRVGVGSTPTIFVNGRKLKSTGVFLLAVDEERKRLGLPPLIAAPPASNSK